MKSTSLLTASLASAIVGLSHMAKAIQISDFTKTSKTGACVDSNGDYFTYAESPSGVVSTEAAMLNYCVSWCGQNLETTFRGFGHFIDTSVPTKFWCTCDYELPNYDDSTPFPYQFTPFPAEVGADSGTGAIVDGGGGDGQCYKYNGTPTGSASPTGSRTPAPTAGQVGASDFTYVGAGDCVDASGEYFSYTESQAFTWTSKDDAAAKCTSWCGQNVNANFRAFAIDSYPGGSPPDFKCDCYFDLPGQMPPYYGYVPPRGSGYPHSGTGSIVKTLNSTDEGDDYFCYKYNGSSGAATNAPTKKPAGSSTNAPTKKPAGSSTNAPTKKPAGSCPVGHPSCTGAADCTPYGLHHCLDGCCTNIGSKSAKGTKSSKRV